MDFLGQPGDWQNFLSKYQEMSHFPVTELDYEGQLGFERKSSPDQG